MSTKKVAFCCVKQEISDDEFEKSLSGLLAFLKQNRVEYVKLWYD